MVMTLIDRLSKLDGPDREVDALIVKHLGLENECPYWLHRFTKSTPMRLTASVDAAIALAERVLPNERVWLNQIAFDGRCQWRASLTGDHTSYSAHAAIALCIAILRAKEASNGQ